MPVLSDLIPRVRHYLLDEDQTEWSDDRIRRELINSVDHLARRGSFGQITWMQAKAGQSVYTTADGIPPRTVRISEVLYNQKPLRFVNEASFTLYAKRWEQWARTPLYWTTDLQGTTSVKISPTPQVTGSSVPLIPGVPLPQTPLDNFVVFAVESPQRLEDGPDVELAIPDGLEDVVVFRAVAALCEDNAETYDPMKAGFFRELANMLVEGLGY